MTTSQAVKKLRKELGLNQEVFAQRLGATLKTVSRYENGNKPRGKFLDVLVTLSDEAQRNDLKDFFAQRKRKELDASIKHLQSEGSARRIPYWHLKAISDDMWDVHEAFENIESLIPDNGAPGEIKKKLRRKLQKVLDALYPWLARDERFLREYEKRMAEEMPF